MIQDLNPPGLVVRSPLVNFSTVEKGKRLKNQREKDLTETLQQVQKHLSVVFSRLIHSNALSRVMWSSRDYDLVII